MRVFSYVYVITAILCMAAMPVAFANMGLDVELPVDVAITSDVNQDGATSPFHLSGKAQGCQNSNGGGCSVFKKCCSGL